MHAIRWFAFGVLAMSLSVFAAEEKLPPAAVPLLVVAWGGVPADKGTVEKYRELGEAGFTINFSGFGGTDAVIKGLDAARAAGVQLMISCPELKKDPEGTVNVLKGHPALAAYYLRDEPDAGLFPELAEWAKRVEAADAKHFPYINLFPTYATPDQMKAANYQEYLDRYMKTVPVKVLSFDHYPVIDDGKHQYLRGDWYDNLERISAAARKAEVPFWAFSICTKCLVYPTATVPHLRCQIFSDLAYGAQGLQYFTYWQVTGSSEGEFTDAPIRADGKRTVVYDRVKQVNAEARGLWPVFCGAKVLTIAHTGASIPAGTRKYVAESPVKSLEAASAVVSHLHNGDRDFLAIVNRDINHAMPVKMEFDRGGIERVEKDSSLRGIDGKTVELTIEPGDMAVVGWKSK